MMIIFDDMEKEKSVFLDIISYIIKEKQTKTANIFSMGKSLEYGNLEIIPAQRTIKLYGNKIELTNYEFEILYLMAKSPGQVFSKDQIYERVWSLPYLGAEDNVVSLIHRIRKKIEPDPARPIYILTVWGIGYKFNGALDG